MRVTFIYSIISVDGDVDVSIESQVCVPSGCLPSIISFAYSI